MNLIVSSIDGTQVIINTFFPYYNFLIFCICVSASMFCYISAIKGLSLENVFLIVLLNYCRNEIFIVEYLSFLHVLFTVTRVDLSNITRPSDDV